MKRFVLMLAALTSVTGIAAGSVVAADNGNAPATLSFFSSGAGAHAGWVHMEDDSPADDNEQAMQIHATVDGFAGVLVHHVAGTPTAAFPNSSFDFKSNLPGPSLGYPRLVILFSDGGRGELRPLTWQTDWTTVADPNWDNNGGACGFVFQTTWQNIQACHPGTVITNAFVTTDPGIDVTFHIDNLMVDGKRFSSAADNGAGDNTTATFTPELLPLVSLP